RDNLDENVAAGLMMPMLIDAGKRLLIDDAQCLIDAGERVPRDNLDENVAARLMMPMLIDATARQSG
ncbi:hypothetical protein, partial [Paraburkholderia sp. RL17-373-BIF-A]|uniref:hypothetical protein n=1 Tax=Paraburkholderia sp. RL17-373-BIF-A TaxID=3031629 RepID=UPI0038BA05D1